MAVEAATVVELLDDWIGGGSPSANVLAAARVMLCRAGMLADRVATAHGGAPWASGAAEWLLCGQAAYSAWRELGARGPAVPAPADAGGTANRSAQAARRDSVAALASLAAVTALSVRRLLCDLVNDAESNLEADRFSAAETAVSRFGMLADRLVMAHGGAAVLGDELAWMLPGEGTLAAWAALVPRQRRGAAGALLS